MRLYLPAPIRDPLLGAVSRLEISFDVQLSLRRLRRYGWKWSRDWEYAVDLAVRSPSPPLAFSVGVSGCRREGDQVGPRAGALSGQGGRASSRATAESRTCCSACAQPGRRLAPEALGAPPPPLPPRPAEHRTFSRGEAAD